MGGSAVDGTRHADKSAAARIGSVRVYAKRQSAEKPAIGGCVGLKDPLWLEAAGNYF